MQKQEYTTSNINNSFINENNIVSANLGEIKVAETFVNDYNLSEFDQTIIKKAVSGNPGGMTDFQCRYFVAGSQITDYKKVRQCMLELEVRYHAYHELRASLRKAEILRKKWTRQMEQMPDELDREMLQVDIEKNDYDISIYKRKLAQSETEINTFMDIVKAHAKSEEDLDYYLKDNPEEEKKYWIARMAKQAAMDIVSYGRVGSGNMDSIVMMEDADQVDTLKLAMKYSGLLQSGLARLQNDYQGDFEAMLNAPDMTAPQLLEKQNEKQNLQFTTQSKAKPESI